VASALEAEQWVAAGSAPAEVVSAGVEGSVAMAAEVAAESFQPTALSAIRGARPGVPGTREFTRAKSQVKDDSSRLHPTHDR